MKGHAQKSYFLLFPLLCSHFPLLSTLFPSHPADNQHPSLLIHHSVFHVAQMSRYMTISLPPLSYMKGSIL